MGHLDPEPHERQRDGANRQPVDDAHVVHQVEQVVAQEQEEQRDQPLILLSLM